MIKKLNFAERACFAKNPLARELFQLLHEKKTQLSLSCDVTSCQEVLDFADLLGPEICVLKTHIDILEDFSLDFIKKLEALAVKHRFLIFEDRKFADIGNTVKHQYSGGIYHIADWAHIVNAHILPGPGIISGLSEVGLVKNRGLLLLASMSSKDNLLDPIYAEKTLRMAEQFPEFVMGFIAQKKLSDDPQWIYMTPGVQLESGQDALGQQYVTPDKAIRENGSDIIIVGRGILKAKDPLSEAKLYRAACPSF
ncbi:MAG TPA: orotidine-5'-phosphate decarboxylase [Gammaproteobacteria bacterium]|jgi:orotidine 5'-phosphate decarboxylase subfamily 1|nr:orotidine-5'-phosphate decarboxylase [Gammaproteobacteria bacterium]